MTCFHKEVAMSVWPAFAWIFPIVCFVLMMLVFMFVMRGGIACMGRHRSPDGSGSGAGPYGSALEILDQRYASGQIDKQEYEEKKAAITVG
jgi:uncharacterized membrane protein